LAERTLAGRGDQIIGDLIGRMRHDGCSGQPGLVELITGIPGASRSVRRIILQEWRSPQVSSMFQS
jgi:hypothetical protein